MDLLQVRNFTRGRLTHRIRPGYGEDYLDLTYFMLSLRIRIESERGESTSVAPDGRSYKRGPLNHLLHSTKSTIQLNRRIFQSKVRIATKQCLRVPRTSRHY